MHLINRKTVKNLEQDRGTHYAWVVLFVATGFQISISFIALGVASLVPFIVSELGISLTKAGFLVGAINVGTAFIALPAGILADRVGEKIVLLVAGMLAGLSVLMSSRVESFWGLTLMMLVIGFGSASATTAGSKGIMTWFPVRRRGFALGFRQIGQPLGVSLAAAILPALALSHGWQGAMGRASLSAFVGVLLVMFFYREKNMEKDLRKKPAPIKQDLSKLFRNKGLWLITFTAMILVGIQFSVMGYLELFIHEGLGYSIRFASYMLALASLAGMFSRIFWGIISDQIFGGRRKKPFLIVTFLTGVICLGLFFMGSGTPWWIVSVLSFLAGFTAMGSNGLYVAMISELAGRDLAGTALGVSISVAQLGVLVIQPLFGFIVDNTGSYPFGWLMLAAITLAAVALIGGVQEKKVETVTETFSS